MAKLKKYYRSLKQNGFSRPKMKILFSTPRFTLLFSTFESNGTAPLSQILPYSLEEKKIITQQKSQLVTKLEAFIAANVHNEQFGVEQLAEMMGMSRSHLHRKLHKIKGKSISRFIREYRLEAAKEMLMEKEMTASEVSHAVGFGSPSYFNKCFTEYFGYSPGKARLKVGQEIARKTESGFLKSKMLLWVGGLAASVLVGLLIFSANKKEAVIAESAPEEKSIIVLPFKNLSSDEENQYLAYGMVDAINRHLSSIESLEVINSVAIGPLTSIKEIGEKLNVSNVLQGSLQKHENTLRIEIKLIDAENGKQIWAESFDRSTSDVLQIQNEIAVNVADALGADLGKAGRSMIDMRSSYDSEAYDYFLRGFHYGYNYSPEAQELAFKNLSKAIEIDSTIAPAYLGLASYYHVKASVIFAELSAKEAFEKSKFYIDKAIELDPGLKEAQGWVGYRKLYFYWDFEGGRNKV